MRAVTYRLARQHALVLAVNNLFDEFYYEKLGLSAAGRVVQGVLPGGVLRCSDAPVGRYRLGGHAAAALRIRRRGRRARWCVSQAGTTSQAPSNVAQRLRRRDSTPAKDYFPDKVTVEDAVNFSVTYHRSYKVVSVRDDGRSEQAERYVLVQCGAPAAEARRRSGRGASRRRADLVAVLGVADASARCSSICGDWTC